MDWACQFPKAASHALSTSGSVVVRLAFPALKASTSATGPAPAQLGQHVRSSTTARPIKHGLQTRASDLIPRSERGLPGMPSRHSRFCCSLTAFWQVAARPALSAPRVSVAVPEHADCLGMALSGTPVAAWVAGDNGRNVLWPQTLSEKQAAQEKMTHERESTPTQTAVASRFAPSSTRNLSSPTQVSDMNSHS